MNENKNYAVCPICNTKFEKDHGNQKYCSKECAYKSKIEKNRPISKRYWKVHRGEKKEYYLAHREEILLKQKERYNSDPEFRERSRTYQREYKRKNWKKYVRYAQPRKERLLELIDEYIAKQRWE